MLRPLSHLIESEDPMSSGEKIPMDGENIYFATHCLPWTEGLTCSLMGEASHQARKTFQLGGAYPRFPTIVGRMVNPSAYQPKHSVPASAVF